MKKFRWWWLLPLLPLSLGFARLRFNAEVLDLLPANVRAVTGLKLYQRHFTSARELIVTIQAPDAEAAKASAQAIAEKLRAETNLVSLVAWQPPWLEHPEQTAELIAYLWLNQPPELFNRFAIELAPTKLASVLESTREQLATTLSPMDLAQLSYDPFGFTRLPESLMSGAAGFGQGDRIFASADGSFRILFVKARGELGDYRECTAWFQRVRGLVQAAAPEGKEVKTGFTGRPAFVTEISASMKRDMIQSVGGTAAIIAALFWLAHRRWRPMLWLLTLLGVILACTLSMGGLIFGTVSVVSMGFAAILLGLAVDYAVVHYQEALAQPELSVPEIRRAIAPSIFWAAVTTICAFLVLNLGGLPGLAQLGTLVAVGVATSALVMIFAYLPPLFPQRMKPTKTGAKTNVPADLPSAGLADVAPSHRRPVLLATAVVVGVCGAVLLTGLPAMDSSADALQPGNSQAYAALEAIKANMSQQREPLWLVVEGASEGEVAERLDRVQPVLERAMTNGVLSSFNSPQALWPRPEFQAANRSVAAGLVASRAALHAAASAGGFAESSLGLTDDILATWERSGQANAVFWPTNQLSSWIMEKLTARDTNRLFAAAFLFPSGDAASLARFDSELQIEGVWLSSWELLGGKVLAEVQSNMWKLLLPMAGLVLLSVWLAFRRAGEVALCLGTLLLSGFCLLATMRLLGWSWNLLNLMALPLILGTGVDYGIFMQLALRRHAGDLFVARRSVGRALLLCGGTAVAGFGSLGFSSNAGMAGLGRVCAVGIGFNMLFSVFLLPSWWSLLPLGPKAASAPSVGARPSQFYQLRFWQAGAMLVRTLPRWFCNGMASVAAGIYWRVAPHRRRILTENMLPVFGGDRVAAARAARGVCAEFALKLTDLWRYEGGAAEAGSFVDWVGWEHFNAAHERGRGVLLVTPHLGNWELGGAFMAKHGRPLLVLTQDEPDPRLTELRQAARARWGVETIVVGRDAFAFVEIIKRLQAGASVALLVDRPLASTAAKVQLFGHDFNASIAVAELARASGCAILPTYIVRSPEGYRARILPEVTYDRASIGQRAQRVRLTQEIMSAFEPAIRQHASQWYHFVPIWPGEDS